MDINVDGYLCSLLCVQTIPYSGKLRGRKLSKILRFCGYTRMFSPQNLVRGILWHGKSEQSAKVFSAKIVFFTNPRKFSPSKSFPLYSIVQCFGHLTILQSQSDCPLVPTSAVPWASHDRRLPQVLKFQRTELWNLRVGVIDCCLRNNTIVLPAPHRSPASVYTPSLLLCTHCDLRSLLPTATSSSS